MAKRGYESNKTGGKVDELLDKIDNLNVPNWALQKNKPSYTAQEVHALPENTPIPTVPQNVSAFNNDAGYLTSHQDISGKEDKSNKVTSLSIRNTDTQYPSAKAVFDNLSTKQDTINDLGSIRSGASEGANSYQVTGDKEYNASAFSGLGRKNLTKNVVGEKNVLTQAMMSEANTIYKIQYDYDLNGQTITVPANCTLEFDGGSFKNGRIIGQNTCIHGVGIIFKESISFGGKFSVNDFKLSWFHKDNSICDYGLSVMGNIGVSIFLDLSKIRITKPIVINSTGSGEHVYESDFRNVRQIHGIPNITEISVECTYDEFDVVSEEIPIKAMLIVNSRYVKVKDIVFSGFYRNGNISADFGVVLNNYSDGISNCTIKGFAKAAIVVTASEHLVISDNYITYCGIAVFALPGGFNSNNMLDTATAKRNIHLFNQGTLSQLEIISNYIVYCNYGLALYSVNICNRIENNCISYTCCCGIILQSNHNSIIHNNYMEGCGASSFWVDKNKSIASINAEYNANVLCSHLAEEHEDIGGVSMVGWGIKQGLYYAAPDYLIIRPVILLTDGNVSVSNLGISCNHTRTNYDYEEGVINNDSNVCGVDTCILSSCNLYLDTTGSVIRRTLSNGIIRYKYLVSFVNITYNSANYNGMANNARKVILKDTIYNGSGILQFGIGDSINFEFTSEYAKPKLNRFYNLTGLYSVSYRETNVQSNYFKNLYNLDGRHIIKDGIMFTHIKNDTAVFRGYSWCFSKEQCKNGLYVTTYIYNDDDTEHKIVPAISRLSSSDNIRISVNLFTNAIPAKTVKRVSAFISPKAIIEDHAVLNISTDNSSDYNLYFSDIFVSDAATVLESGLTSEVTDRYGRMIKGATGTRPLLSNDDAGFEYFDTTLGKPIYWNGTAWVDATGTAVS